MAYPDYDKLIHLIRTTGIVIEGKRKCLRPKPINEVRKTVKWKQVCGINVKQSGEPLLNGRLSAEPVKIFGGKRKFKKN